MDNIAKKLNILDALDWQHVTIQTLKQQKAYYLVKKYGFSLSKLLGSIYPEYKQACRAAIIKTLHDLNMSVQDLPRIPLSYIHMREPKLFRQHGNSITTRTHLSLANVTSHCQLFS